MMPSTLLTRGWASMTGWQTGIEPEASKMCATYGELLGALEEAVEQCAHGGASAQLAEISAFVSSLDASSRAILEQESRSVGWTRRRRERLKAKWAALDLHRGSWHVFTERLNSAGTGKFSRETLRAAARDLAYLGPPGVHRRAFWRFCVGFDSGVTKRELPSVREAVSKWDKSQLEQIQLDVGRTPNLTADQQASLGRVLAALCLRDVEHKDRVNYTQGMHLLAACPLWIGMQEQEAFAVCDYTLRHFCSRYYSDEDFSNFKRDAWVTEMLLSESMPRLRSALRASGLPVMVLLFDPLLCLFTHHLPCSVAQRLWDVLLVEAEAEPVVVIAMLLALLEKLVPEGTSTTGREDILDMRAGNEAPQLVEQLNERSAALSSRDVELVLSRAKVLLDGPDPEGDAAPATADGSATKGLRSRVEELRREAAQASTNSGSSWMDQERNARSNDLCPQM